MLHFRLISLSGQKFNDDVYEVVLPTLDGQIGVMQNHMPLISVATIGVIMVRRQAGDADYLCEYFATNGGAIEIADNHLNVLVDEADHADDINQAEVEAAMTRAKTMKAEAKDKLSLDRAQNLMDHQAARLQVANLRRHHKKP